MKVAQQINSNIILNDDTVSSKTTNDTYKLDDLLYKGPDIEVQLRKIGEAATRLPEISALANEKKWSAIQGIITVR